MVYIRTTALQVLSTRKKKLFKVNQGWLQGVAVIVTFSSSSFSSFFSSSSSFSFSPPFSLLLFVLRRYQWTESLIGQSYKRPTCAKRRHVFKFLVESYWTRAREPGERPRFSLQVLHLCLAVIWTEFLVVGQNAETFPLTLGQDNLLLTRGKCNPSYEQMAQRKKNASIGSLVSLPNSSQFPAVLR